MTVHQVAPKLLSWGSLVEPNTIEQAARTSRLPFVAGHVALMPDAHIGMGATIGSVIPTLGAIIPSAVGVDIGCGMIAVETHLRGDDLPDDLGKLHSRIAQVVPAGVGTSHDSPRYCGTPARFSQKEASTAAKQVGTLGSGNHFVEICLDERFVVWVVLHSGSRGIGNQLATKHIAGAKKLMKQYFIELEDPDLAYLVEGTPDFQAYIDDMLWAQDYALLNRELMMNAVLVELFSATFPTSFSGERINCHHNFTQREHHHGKNLWITRKGAIQARVGDKGVIPGSMGTRSYIVSGKGNEASYSSCAHGAGRAMSRGQALKAFTVSDLNAAMEGKTWNGSSEAWGATNAKALLDEHPLSYKDIDTVMADQADLVTIEHTLSQILNYKGA